MNTLEPDVPTIAKLRDAVARIHAQSGGAFDLYLFDPIDTVRLLANVLLGSAHASRLLRGVTSTASRVQRSARKPEAVLCMCCSRSVRRLDGGTKIGIVAAASDDATDALGFAVCPQCSAKQDLAENVTEALQRIWPGLRPITVTHPGGGTA